MVLAIVFAMHQISGFADPDQDTPSVVLSKVPSLSCGPGGTGELKGKASGLPSSKDYRIVIYSKCEGVYYVQPTAVSYLTDIDDDGSFAADVHGAQEYVALLVKDGYKSEAQLDQLPKPGGKVIARSKAKRPEKP